MEGERVVEKGVENGEASGGWEGDARANTRALHAMAIVVRCRELGYP